MRKILPIIALTGALAIAAWTGAGAPATIIEIEIFNGEGQSIGTASVEDADGGGVAISVIVAGLSPGPHGIHIHETGRCDPPDFESAGAHFNPTNTQHGSMNPQGPHAGDLPNLIVDQNGTAQTSIAAPLLNLESGDQTSILDHDGAALVIHAAADDYKTDPSGESGDRIACGVIEG
jgi:Cu-Zn family superoxide dismutase